MAITHQAVVAESVVVMRQLLQMNPDAHKKVIRSMVKLLDTVHNPKARQAIVWIIGEYRYEHSGRCTCMGCCSIGAGVF